MELAIWLTATNMSTYSEQLRNGGVVKGVDLQTLDDACLHSLGVCDDLHRLVILECLEELIKGSSSLVGLDAVLLYYYGMTQRPLFTTMMPI